MVGDTIKFLPLDKSWYIRLCILSLHDNRVIDFLDGKELCDDLKSTVNAVKNFNHKTIGNFYLLKNSSYNEKIFKND